jgi:hypothetical protein
LSAPPTIGTGANVTLDANGHTVTLSGGGKNRLFQVTGGTLTIKGLTLTPGAATPAAATNGTTGT